MASETKLTWKRTGDWHISSHDSRYRIVKNIVNEVPRYVPYRIEDDKRTMLSNGLMTVEAAKLVCETDNKRASK